MATKASDSRSWRTARAAVFESQLQADWRDEGIDRDTLARSQYGHLTKAATDAAADCAATGSSDPDDTEFQWLASSGSSVIRTLRSALGRFEKEADRTLLIWRHIPDAAQRIVKNQAPPMSRLEIEAAADEYLSLPYRVPELDRLLVDILVALELFAYGDEVSGNKPMSGGGLSPLKLKPIRSFLIGHGSNLLLGIVVGSVAWGASLIHLFPERWLPALWGILLLLFLGRLLIGAVAFPRFWLAATKARKRSLDLLSAMNGVYSELNSTGPISTNHIQQRAQATSAEGVVWPSPLFVLLDDINARSGRI